MNDNLGISNKAIDKGMVLRIEKSSIHDGPGLRTVVFLKGCPLNCKWCSTPESQSFQVENGHSGSKVIKYGMEMTVEEVVKEIMKDSVFYFHSDGGMTLSGGEVLSQPDFAANILKECKRNGINTAIETSFYSNYENIEKVLPYLDHLFVDIKHMNSEEHKKWVGSDNNIILDNIKRADKSDCNFKIHVRVPIIPSINDEENNLTEVALFCKNLFKLEEIELLKYHRLGTDTYKKLGRNYELKNIESPTNEYMYKLAVYMKKIAPEINVKVDGKYVNV
ncbi:MAG: glycyl-radical enzyme activating protein [Tissierellia bacterium]|nr:glycyl-radical enzyme activating protein [Tissierellia bacterium]MDD4780678.1 glycyl-radical enzyme activating protein [Tissierellia bacterium]